MHSNASKASLTTAISPQVTSRRSNKPAESADDALESNSEVDDARITAFCESKVRALRLEGRSLRAKKKARKAAVKSTPSQKETRQALNDSKQGKESAEGRSSNEPVSSQPARPDSRPGSSFGNGAFRFDAARFDLGSSWEQGRAALSET